LQPFLLFAYTNNNISIMNKLTSNRPEKYMMIQ